MISGNVQKARISLTGAVLEAIKEAVTDGRPTNWDHKSWTRSLLEFDEIAGQAADAMVKEIQDRGDVAYLRGTLKRPDIERGIDYVEGYFAKTFTIKSYFKKRFRAFRVSFERRFTVLTKEWKGQADVYFSVSGSREGGVRPN